MKAQQRPSASTGSAAPVTSFVGREPETSASNAAVAEQLAGSEQQVGAEGESGSIFSALADWFRSLFSSDAPETRTDTPTLDRVVEDTLHVDGPARDEVVEQVLDETVETADPELATAPPEGIARAATIRAGQFGAALGASGPHDVRSGPGADAAVTSTLRDGTPVTVVSVQGGSVEVRWNVGEEQRTGWIDAAVFSPQPRLNTKDLGAGFSFQRFAGDAEAHSTEGRGDDLSGEDVTQGGLANCFFIAAMNAVGNANGEFLREAITYDEKTGLYTVRFYERSGFDPSRNQVTYRIHTEVVDGMLPTRQDGALAYARATGPSAWGPIYEKAYAQWKGGYDKIGAGGVSGEAMTALTGRPSVPSSAASMKEDEILTFFQRAKESGTAVICGSLDSMQSQKQAPLTASGRTTTEATEGGERRVAFEGPYAGTLAMPGERQNIKAGTVQVTDKGGKVAAARDTGKYGDKSGAVVGTDVAEGELVYDSRRMSLTFKKGKGPDAASDLEVAFNYRGLLNASLKVFAWHAYVFSDVVDGKIKLYNPWGSWQPELMTPAQFKTYYANISSNSVPQTAESSAGG